MVIDSYLRFHCALVLWVSILVSPSEGEGTASAEQEKKMKMELTNQLTN
jgi:hypothetical protein